MRTFGALVISITMTSMTRDYGLGSTPPFDVHCMSDGDINDPQMTWYWNAHHFNVLLAQLEEAIKRPSHIGCCIEIVFPQINSMTKRGQCVCHEQD